MSKTPSATLPLKLEYLGGGNPREGVKFCQASARIIVPGLFYTTVSLMPTTKETPISNGSVFFANDSSNSARIVYRNFTVSRNDSFSVAFLRIGHFFQEVVSGLCDSGEFYREWPSIYLLIFLVRN